MRPTPPPSPPKPRQVPSEKGSFRTTAGDRLLWVFAGTCIALMVASLALAIANMVTEGARAHRHAATAIEVNAWSRAGSGCRGPSSGTSVAARLADGRVLQLTYSGVVRPGWVLDVKERGWIWGIDFGESWSIEFAQPPEQVEAQR